MIKKSNAITGQIFLLKKNWLLKLIIEEKQIKKYTKIFSLVCSVFTIETIMVEVCL